MKNSKHLGISYTELKRLAAVHTASEISQQPSLWMEIFRQIRNDERIGPFLSSLRNEINPAVILTGAGSSDFIGKSVAHTYFQLFGSDVRAVSTTTLVTHFRSHADPEKPLLLISFARSGNSPESMAVIDIADRLCRQVWHLVITCNAEGALAKEVEKRDNSLVLLLPPQANDRSLAMTGSFSGMALTALLTAGNAGQPWSGVDIEPLCRSAERLLADDLGLLESIAALPFTRAVFLGSGPLLGIARESHLKLQELTDGEVICKFDSFLGFRHGPKAVVDSNTLVVYLFSPDPDVFRYELDLANQIAEEDTALETVGLFSRNEQPGMTECGRVLLFREVGRTPFDLLIPLYVLPAQLLGFYKSLERGLEPDNPSRNGSISRVVRGVTIYPPAETGPDSPR